MQLWTRGRRLSKSDVKHPRSGALRGLGCVIILPTGPQLGGVTVWAEHTTQAVKAAGGRCTTIGPGLCTSPADSSRPLVDMIIEASRSLCATGVDRVVLAPQLSGQAYAAAASAAHAIDDPGISIVGWMHTDIRYDTELIRRFAPCLSCVICVSQAAADQLAGSSACPPAMLRVARTGVPFSGRVPAAHGPAHDPVRLLYVGRLEAFQKRVLALPAIVERLRDAGASVSLTIVGDGPARTELAKRAAGVEGIALQNAVTHSDLPPLYATHDMLLLPSRSEGLGLARIEAAMHGCVPVVTPGGSAEGIRHGHNGFVADCPADLDDDQAAERFACVVSQALARPLDPMRSAAVRASRSMFGMGAYASALVSALTDVRAAEPHRHAWRRVASDPHRYASFTVPDNLVETLHSSLADLAGQPIVLHGAGAHTIAIWEPLCRLGVRVVAVTDDDPQQWGRSVCGVPVLAPHSAGIAGSRCVVISSWLHEEQIWRRRRVYEAQGLVVRRIYAPIAEVQPAG